MKEEASDESPGRHHLFLKPSRLVTTIDPTGSKDEGCLLGPARGSNAEEEAEEVHMLTLGSWGTTLEISKTE